MNMGTPKDEREELEIIKINWKVIQTNEDTIYLG